MPYLKKFVSLKGQASATRDRVRFTANRAPSYNLLRGGRMTYTSVPALPLSRNDVISLAQFYQIAFKHFLTCKSSLEKSYLENIRVISDCYSLTLIERGMVSINDDNLNEFRRYWSFKQFPETLEKLALAIAEMISFIADKIKLANHPWFYEDFVSSIKNTLGDRISYLYGDLVEAKRLEEILLRKS